MGTKRKHNKIQRIITFPIRFLVKARDSYVRSMNGFAERGSYGGFSVPPPVSCSSNNLSKSNSVSSSGSSYMNEDMAELIRAASVKRLGGKLTEEISRWPVREYAAPASASASGVVPRSVSVGMGKIDENSPCEFGEELGSLGVARAEVMYPRSKSAYAVAKRRPMI